MSNLRLAAATIAGVLLLVGVVPAQQPAEPEPLVREIFVPFEDLNVLLETDTERVFLTRDQYEELIDKAKQTPIDSPPRDIVLLAADYDAVIADGRTTITARLTIESLTEDLVALPLAVSNVGIRQATLNDQPASLGRGDDGQPILFVEAIGQHTLDLEIVTPLATSAAQQSLQLGLPTPAASRFGITVPGNVELRSGAAVISREVDTEANVTRFELLPSRGQLSLVMSLNNRLLLEQQVVVARSVIVDEVTQAYERVHATISLGVLQGAVDRFRFTLPEGFEVTSVESPVLSRWEIETDDQGQRALAAILREPTTETVVLTISAVNSQVRMDDWTMPTLAPLDVRNHVSVVGLLVDERLAAESIEASDLIRVDNAVLRAALPETIFQVDPGAPTIRPIVAYYAPQDTFGLAARFTTPPARINAITNVQLTLGDQQQHVVAAFAVVPEVEKLFTVDIASPAGWQVVNVAAEEGTALPYELLDGDDGPETRIHIRLPQGVAAGTARRFSIEATRTPAGWLDQWTDQSLDYPVFRVRNAAVDRGAITVVTTDDLVATPDQLTAVTALDKGERAGFGLTESDSDLAFRYISQPYSVSINVERLQPRITARTFNFLRIEPEGVIAHYELVFDVQRARTRRLVFSLPEGTPPTVAIRGLNGLAVKETTSEAVDGRRRWTAQLSAASIGELRLAVDFEQRLGDDQTIDLDLPLAVAEDVSYQTSIVAVEGNSDFDISVTTDGRKVDVGELVESEYRVGRRLLGAFGFASEAAVNVEINRRPAYGLPEAIVERAELATVVSAGGKRHTAARYLLRTKAAFLQVRLPDGTALWSATVDGKPSIPQRESDGLLISLPPDRADRLRDLQIVFEDEDSSIGVMGDVTAIAPTLVVRNSAVGYGYEVPVADLQWQLVLPDLHRIVRTRGTVYLDESHRRRMKRDTKFSPVQAAVAALYVLSGGIDPFYRNFAPKVAYNAATTSEPTARPRFGYQQGLVLDSADADMSGAMAGAAPPTDGAVIELQETLELARPMAESEAMPDDAPAAPPASREPAPATPAEVPADPFGVPGDQAPAADGEADEEEFWALEGVRSLEIAVDRAGEMVEFRSMGVAPRLRVTLVHRHRLEFLAVCLAIVVGVIGVVLTNESWRRRMTFVLQVLLGALLLPLLIGWAFGLEITWVFDAVFYAGCAVLAYYVLVSVLRWLAARLASLVRFRRAATAAMFVALAAGSASGQEAAAINSDDLINLLRPAPPVTLPADAVIIPYDPEDADGTAAAEKVLVPYEQYVKLWNLAFPDQPVGGPQLPADYAFAGATYSTTLVGDDHLVIEGVITLDVFSTDAVEVALPLTGGVLTRAILDGAPAKLRVVAPQAVQQQEQQKQNQQAVAQPAAPAAVIALHVEGQGRKQLEFAARFTLSRSGGWRIARGQLPIAPANDLTINVPSAETDVRISGVHDRPSYETSDDNEAIQTSLVTGAFQLQWRARVSSGQVDQGLTAESLALLDIQEDGVRLAWQLQLEFRQGERDSFTVDVPAEYLIERVTGDNVRGWRPTVVDGRQQIDVTLLRAVSGKETLVFHLSRRAAVGQDGATQVTAPIVTVPEAMFHRGTAVVRRSPLLDVRTTQVDGLERDEIDDAALSALVASITEQSPLGIRPFQVYRFSTTPFTLELSATAERPRASVEVRSIVRIAERVVTLESRVLVNAADRTLHQLRLFLPDNLSSETIEVSHAGQRAITNVDGRRMLTVYLAAGAPTAYVDVKGELSRAADGRVAAPRIEVLDVDRQSGQIAVQLDRDMNVAAEELVNCESVLIGRAYGWLAGPQRASAKLVLEYSTPDYSGWLRTTARRPTVNNFSITNVRITPRDVVESVLIEFLIRNAGIRQVHFELPAEMRDAEITVPLLRQKTIREADDPSRIHVTLELQEAIIDQLIVVVRHSRALTDGEIEAALPVVITGATEHRYVVIENAGRDEIEVVDDRGLVEVNRQLAAWSRLTEALGTSITQAYVVRDDNDPRLALAARQRSTVETAGARIGLATTRLLVDAHGAYRGVQQYQVDNKTEQFLEIELPAGTLLWSAQVDGEPVKPTVVPGAADDRQVRIPLIKNAEGDLDYAVVLKYGGHLKSVGFTATTFPFIRSTNIGVEESQVRLWLPETHRWWNFAGTMTRVFDRGDLAAGKVSYRNRQMESLVQVLKSGKDEFAKARAATNLKQLTPLFGRSGEQANTFQYNDYFQRELATNSAILAESQREIAQVEQQQNRESLLPGNYSRLMERFSNQNLNPSKNTITELGDNFDTVAPARQTAKPQAGLPAGSGIAGGGFGGGVTASEADKPQLFNNEWLRSNALDARESRSVAASNLRFSAESATRSSAVEFSEQKLLQKGLPQFRGKLEAQKKKQLPESTRGGELADQVERYRARLMGEQRGQQQMQQRVQQAQPQQPNGRPQVISGLVRGDMPQSGPVAEGIVFSDGAVDYLTPRTAGLASLDVTFPDRGVEYLFRTPRGEVEITARAVTHAQLDRLVSVGGIIGLAALLFASFHLLRFANDRLTGRKRATTCLVLGIASLITGVFPIVGIALTVHGITCWYRSRAEQRQTTASPT